MQLPKEGSHYLVFARYARYVARRLRRAGRTQLAADLLATATALKAAGRAWDDADEPVQDAMADRDAADDALDALAQSARATLAGRGVNAVSEEPYKLIFPEGMDYYLAAPLSEEVSRYSLLAERLALHLPASDEVRKLTVKHVHKGLEDYAAATRELGTAQNGERHAHDAVASAIAHLNRQLEKVYGQLVTDLGRAAADRFFPKARALRAGAKAAPEAPPAPAAAG